MKYEKIITGSFVERPNRFIAKVLVGENVETCHVKNTGRCKELLIPGATVYLEDFEGRMGIRKLRYSLIAVRKGELLINMDSQAPNKVVREALASGKIDLGMRGDTDFSELRLIAQEKTYGDSRFDFYVEGLKGAKAYAEVKGVTLEDLGVVRFPDAPTARGVKHIRELMAARAAGFGAFIIFVIQMDGMKEFRPNDDTHPEFGQALREASLAGVSVLAYGCKVTEDTLEVGEPVPVVL